MTKLYVASSWRNTVYTTLLQNLRDTGHECYDFRNPGDGDDGFSWSKVDPEWKSWTLDQYNNGLLHPASQQGFKLDKSALDWCEQLVLVLPCGKSAHVEAGYASGCGKKVHVYIPQGMKEDYKGNPIWEPELMYLLFTTICGNLDGLNYALHKHRPK